MRVKPVKAAGRLKVRLTISGSFSDADLLYMNTSNKRRDLCLVVRKKREKRSLIIRERKEEDKIGIRRN